VDGATLQAVSVPAFAQAVDEGAQLPHVVHPAGHHHLLVDHVGLRQVGSLLWSPGAGKTNIHRRAVGERGSQGTIQGQSKKYSEL